MGLETENAVPIWVAQFKHVDGVTAVQEALATGTYNATIATFTEQPDALLIQATGGNVYWRMDGNAATVASFLLKSEDPPVLFPWPPGGVPYSFTGADANAHLIIQPVTVH